MGNIAEVLIILFIIGLNFFFSGRKKIKRENEVNGEEAEGEETDSQASGMEELRERMRKIKADAYWQQFRERIVPPEPTIYQDEEEYDAVTRVDVNAEEEEEEEYSPPQITETVEEIIAYEDKIEPIEKTPETAGYIFNLGRTEMQRGIILAEILSPCLAKREKGVRRI